MNWFDVRIFIDDIKEKATKAVSAISGSGCGSAAIWLAGRTGGKAGGAMMLHGLKVIGLGSAYVGMVSTGFIAIITCHGTYKGIKMLTGP